jgi:L-alanine-DL-glutamate epimerase-like enolase superfamily enzyme
MRITEVRTTPLRLRYKSPFHWARGMIEAAEIVLVEVRTDAGLSGYGESMSTSPAGAIQSLLHAAGNLCIGHSPFEITSLMERAYQKLFAARGNCSAPRFGAQLLAGLDMALWDLAGKATGRAVHELLGGAVRDHIQYFGFPQGESVAEVVSQARESAASGCEVIYVKVGRGEAFDLAIVQQVRAAVSGKRLRLDANEAWDALTAVRMIRKLADFGIEFVEQPTRSDSIAALAHVKAATSVAIAADQSAFTPEDVYEICRHRAADLIVLGLHESGGIGRLRKAAAIAEAAGLNVCLHGLYESGITTCASNQAGATLTNLDDGNQYMNHFLIEDIIQRPNLTLEAGRLPVLSGPGLGFELNWDAIERAREAHQAAS